MASVLLSASVERCFVSRMRDFLGQFVHIFGLFFVFLKKIGFLSILGPPYCGIDDTIRIGREMLCFP